MNRKSILQSSLAALVMTATLGATPLFADTYFPGDDPTIVSFNQRSDANGNNSYFAMAEFVAWGDDPDIASFNEWYSFTNEHPTAQSSSMHSCGDAADDPTLAYFDRYSRGYC